MKIIKEGHKYELENFEDKSKPGQMIQFIQKGPGKEGGSLATICDGTTNEEVLEMLIDRLEFLNGIMPSRYNEAAIGGLKAVSMALKSRTKERETRGVEGTSKP